MHRANNWNFVADVTFTPNTPSVDVGSVTLANNAAYLFVRITDITGEQPWPFSYGILSWRSSAGRELGSTKAYSAPSGEVFRLGGGLPPSDRSGVLTFQPRGYNLAWINKGNSWKLRFEQQSVATENGGEESTMIIFPSAYAGNTVPYVLSDARLATLNF